MGFFYEIIKESEINPTKVSIYSVASIEMHWHSEIEIIMVLEGSIQIRKNNKLYLLEEEDIIIINSGDVHSMVKTEKNNILLAVQISMEDISRYYPKIKYIRFDCEAMDANKENQKSLDITRYFLAKLVKCISKKRAGYELSVASYTYHMVEHFINNFNYHKVDEKRADRIDNDLDRVQRILNYIYDNLDKGVNLQDIADIEDLSVSYLSRIISDQIGMSFQQYVNNLRLDRAMGLLYNTNKTLTQIAFESGFPSSKSFNKLFKDNHRLTPTEFREKNIKHPPKESIIIAKSNEKTRTYLDVDRKKAFKKLFKYLTIEDPDFFTPNELIIKTDKEKIQFSGREKGKSYKPYWKNLTSFSRASDGLKTGLKNQLNDLQEDIGFNYVRFYGIFSDDMLIYNIDKNGKIVYNWSYANKLFDFLLEINLKPFVEFSFIADANLERPKDINLWKDLVKAFVINSINRYGIEEVKTWYFDVWNEADFEWSYRIGNRQDYFEFYEATVRAIKSVSGDLRVGGPGVVERRYKDESWLEDFLLDCQDRKVPLDFVSLHIYAEKFDEKRENDKGHTYNSLVNANELISEKLSHKPELHITKWKAPDHYRNLIYDTCFLAARIVSNAINCIGENIDSLCYPLLSDLNEESKPGISHFHGGFGLINKDGLKKPSYYAYYLLNKLGDKIIQRGKDYIICKSSDNIQILVCNYVYFDDLFIAGDTSALTDLERYEIYKDKPAKEIYLKIKDLKARYKITNYKLDRDHGSVFDNWIRLGANENMSKEEIKYLKMTSHPKMEVSYKDIEGDYEENLHIPVHGVKLITLEKQY